MAEPPPRPNLVDGRVQFLRLGHDRAPWADLYHELLVASWPVFIGATFLVYLIVLAAFAGLYLLGGDCYGAGEATGPLSAFAFSVQTLTTIGYGTLAPTTPWAHALVTTEVFVGLLGVGLFSGLCFAKFGRPTSRMAFAHHGVITRYDHHPTLMLRVANERNSNIIAARVAIYALLDVETDEGHRMRRFFPLRPVREETPVFSMSWLVMHTIDEHSLLAPLVTDGAMPELAAIIVSVTGTDATFAQTVHGQAYLQPEQLRIGHRYVDMIREVDGMMALDHARLHDTVPDPAWPR